MNARTILAFSIVFTLLVCGCTVNNAIEHTNNSSEQTNNSLESTNNVSKQTNSDDDLYLKSLDDYVSSFQPVTQQSTNQFSQEEMVMAELKIQSTTFSERVAPLKVSSKFEFSKNSFLQSMKETELYSDFILSHYAKISTAENWDSLTAEEQQEIEDANIHQQNSGLFLIKAYDSNVCSAAGEKYANVTLMCNAFSRMTQSL